MGVTWIFRLRVCLFSQDQKSRYTDRRITKGGKSIFPPTLLCWMKAVGYMLVAVMILSNPEVQTGELLT